VQKVIENTDSTLRDESHQKIKPIIQVFKGNSDKISIEIWIKRYEMIANYHQWNDKDKLVLMGDFLEDEALTWYVEKAENLSYLQLKNSMLSRFGVETVDPFLECIHLKYDI
jgi:hypothetical protein